MPDAPYPKTVTAAEAEAFFRNRSNFEHLTIEQIYQILGYPDLCADWDLGRVYCEWSDWRRKVCVYTHSNSRVHLVQLLRSRIFFLFGSRTTVLWAERLVTGKRAG